MCTPRSHSKLICSIIIFDLRKSSGMSNSVPPLEFRMRYKSYKVRVERNEIQRERRLSKDLNEQKKKNGKNDPGSKKTYKKKKKTQKGWQLARLHVRGDREREGERQAAQAGESLLGPSEKSKRDTNTRNRLRRSVWAAAAAAAAALLLLPLATSSGNGASAQGNWIEFPVGRWNSALWPVAFFKVWRKNKKATTTTKAQHEILKNNNNNEAKETKSTEDLRNRRNKKKPQRTD